MGRDDGGIFLDWLRNVLPTMRKCAGNFYGEMQMNDEESDGGGLFIALVKVVIAVFFFCLFVAVVASIVWGLIA